MTPTGTNSTMTDDEDLALHALLALREELVPDLDEQLLRNCYAVERRHQFSADRTQSSLALERLIDEAVAAHTIDAGAE